MVGAPRGCGAFTVGLRNDGTAVAVGDNSLGQCNVDDWTGLIAISAGQFHTIGLREDGTVLTTQQENMTVRTSLFTKR